LHILWPFWQLWSGVGEIDFIHCNLEAAKILCTYELAGATHIFSRVSDCGDGSKPLFDIAIDRCSGISTSAALDVLFAQREYI
jgi:hypothetical protein